MSLIKLDPREYPLKEGESWWLIHPNYSKCELRLPVGGVTVCTEELEISLPISPIRFSSGVAYGIVGADNHNGWVTMQSMGIQVEMPQYMFSRHFDAEAFIVGTLTTKEKEYLIDQNYWVDQQRGGPVDYMYDTTKNEHNITENDLERPGDDITSELSPVLKQKLRTIKMSAAIKEDLGKSRESLRDLEEELSGAPYGETIYPSEDDIEEVTERHVFKDIPELVDSALANAREDTKERLFAAYKRREKKLMPNEAGDVKTPGTIPDYFPVKNNSCIGGNNRKEVYTSEEDEKLWDNIIITAP